MARGSPTPRKFLEMSENVGPIDPTLARVRVLAQPLVAALGVDLVDVAWAVEGGRRTLRVTIERVSVAPNGADAERGWGVSLEDCADVSRDLSHVLDAEDAVPGAFNLEVSSPGLDRALHTADEFRRFAGQLAKAKLARPAPDGQRLLRGTLAGVGGAAGHERVTIDVDGNPIEVPFADIVDAHLVFELHAAARPGKPQPRKKGAKPPGPGAKKVSGGSAAKAGATIEAGSLGRKANVRSES